MPHWRPPGRRESGQEASPPSIYLTRISISCRLPLRRSARCAWAGIRSSGGATEFTRFPKATRLHHPAFPCSSLPRIQSPRRRCQPVRHSRKRRIRREACCGCAGIRDSGGGPSHPMQCRELPVSINSAFQCSIPGSVRSPGRFQDSALKCSMAAPAATRRLRGHPSNDTPIALARGWKMRNGWRDTG